MSAPFTAVSLVPSVPYVVGARKGACQGAEGDPPRPPPLDAVGSAQCGSHLWSESLVHAAGEGRQLGGTELATPSTPPPLSGGRHTIAPASPGNPKESRRAGGGESPGCSQSQQETPAGLGLRGQRSGSSGTKEEENRDSQQGRGWQGPCAGGQASCGSES